MNIKNLLSENMLRFGTKNLSEAQQKELLVKSIMETIDQNGLHTVIRKRLQEQRTPKPPFPKRNPAQEKALNGSASSVYGVNLTMFNPIPMKVKPNAYYELQSYHGGYNPDGNVNSPTSYMYLPKGTTFYADANTNCAYAFVQQGSKWKTGQAPVGKDGRPINKAMMLDNTVNGSIITSLDTVQIPVTFNLSSGELITQGNIPYMISDTLFNALLGALKA